MTFSNIDKNIKKSLISLINDDLIEVLSDKFIINPHIKAFNLRISKEEQINELTENKSFVVAYPTEKALKDIDTDDKKPFLQMLQKGMPKLTILHFNIKILEDYFNDPKYLCNFNGYRGYIVIKDEYYDEDSEFSYIEDFGISYHKTENYRAVGVFVDTLANLSLYEQIRWKQFYYNNQKDFQINKPFYDNLIIGEWTEYVSIYDAILDEVKVINQMCKNMKIPQLFKEEFEPHSYKNIEDYRIMFYSTQKNYYNFILILEKMFVNNINKETFTITANGFKGILKTDENNIEKGSIQMFQEWLSENVYGAKDLNKAIFATLKDIRKQRQKPAHNIMENEYKKELSSKQDEIIKELYSSIRNIRLLFANYPGNTNIEIPKYLITGEFIYSF